MACSPSLQAQVASGLSLTTPRAVGHVIILQMRKPKLQEDEYPPDEQPARGDLGFEPGKSGTEANVLGYSTQLPPGKVVCPAHRLVPSPCHSACHIVGGLMDHPKDPVHRRCLGIAMAVSLSVTQRLLLFSLLAPESQVLVPSVCAEALVWPRTGYFVLFGWAEVWATGQLASRDVRV